MSDGPTIRFTLTTPAAVLADLEVRSVTLPSVGGQCTVLAGHDRELFLLAPGECFVRTRDDMGRAPPAVRFRLKTGCAEVTPGAVCVYVPAAETVESKPSDAGRAS